MSSEFPVYIKFTKGTVRVAKDSTTGLLREYDPTLDVEDSIAGIGYSITCVVETNSLFSGDDLIADPNCFVLKHVENKNPVFTRICSIADMDYILKKRSSMVSGDIYRSNVFTVVYNDVDTALASLIPIRDRVSSLYSGRLELLGSFYGETSQEFLPLQTQQITQQQFVDTYTSKKSARQELELLYEKAKTELSLAKEKQTVYLKMLELLSTLTDKLDKARQSISDTTPALSSVPAVIGAMTVLENFIGSIPVNDDVCIYVTNNSLRAALESIKDSMNASLLGSGVGQSVSVGNVTLPFYLTNLYLELFGQKTASNQTQYNATAYVDSYASQLKESKQVLDQAIAAEAAALADIARYCPDVNLNSI
jgi:hypothetical protein